MNAYSSKYSEKNHGFNKKSAMISKALWLKTGVVMLTILIFPSQEYISFSHIFKQK